MHVCVCALPRQVVSMTVLAKGQCIHAHAHVHTRMHMQVVPTTVLAKGQYRTQITYSAANCTAPLHFQEELFCIA